jgi:hypothetical protein
MLVYFCIHGRALVFTAPMEQSANVIIIASKYNLDADCCRISDIRAALVSRELFPNGNHWSSFCRSLCYKSSHRMDQRVKTLVLTISLLRIFPEAFTLHVQIMHEYIKTFLPRDTVSSPYALTFIATMFTAECGITVHATPG